VLPKDEMNATSSSWFNEKEPSHGAVTCQHRSDEMGHREGKKKGDDVSWDDVNLTRLKIKKINAVDSAGTNRW
jgi:hypothetical protein